MNDGYTWWLVLVGIGVGLALMWLTLARLPRDEADVSDEERLEEASWIAATIESRGGICPPELAAEVLDLHESWLTAPPTRIPAPRDDASLIAR
ncbi:MAG: hypothetical protein KF809_17520 [Chloroflexi bacterium]|nr:hypothetical protein [Chloroflexota bacterium]